MLVWNWKLGWKWIFLKGFFGYGGSLKFDRDDHAMWSYVQVPLEIFEDTSSKIPLSN